MGQRFQRVITWGKQPHAPRQLSSARRLRQALQAVCEPSASTWANTRPATTVNRNQLVGHNAYGLNPVAPRGLGSGDGLRRLKGSADDSEPAVLDALLLPLSPLVALFDLRSSERHRDGKLCRLARVCSARSLSHLGRADTSMRVSQSCEPESSYSWYSRATRSRTGWMARTSSGR